MRYIVNSINIVDGKCQAVPPQVALADTASFKKMNIFLNEHSGF